MYKNFLLLLFLFISSQLVLQAQIVTTHYGLQEGLPSSETFFGYQDDSSYLWFTTDRGIVKYDGYEFKTYTTKDGLAELVNLKILGDPAGGFVVMGKGSQITFYRDGVFTPFKHNGQLLRLTEEQDYRLDIIDIGINKILLNDLSSLNRKYYEVDRETGDIKQLYFNELKLIKWSSVSKIDLDAHSLSNGLVIIKRYPSGIGSNYLIQINNVYNHASISGEEVILRELPKGAQFGFMDQNKGVWYSGNNKLTYIHPDGKKNTVLYQEVSSVIEDNDGNIWATTPANGIYRIKLNTFLKKIPIPGLEARVVDIYAQSNHIKLYTISSNNNYKYYMIDSVLYSDFNKTKYLLNNYEVKSSMPLSDDFTFLKIDPSLTKIKSLFDYSVLVNYEIDNERLIFEKNGNIFIVKNKDYFIGKELSYIYDFIKSDSLYLFGTTNGLKMGQFENNVDLNLIIKDTVFINSRVNDMDKGVNGDIWIATLQQGVYRYNNGSLKKIVNPFHQFNSINSIEVLDSIAFVGTSTGLLKIEYETVNDSVIINSSEFLGIAGGLSPPYVKSIEHYQEKIILGTLQGIYFFHVDSFKLTDAKPKIFLNGIYQKNKKLGLQDHNAIKFKSSNNFFSIKYNGISYTKDPVIPFYRYSFHSGDSTKWVFTQSREINFSDIAPGDYEFVVQCRNNANQWSDPASISLTIQPPFFQTWTFRIGSILLLGSLIWTFFYIRSRNVQRQQAIKNEILSVQMQSTRSQMNPHFVFNGMNAIQNFIFSGDKEGANRYLTTFSSLLRDSLQMANKEYISLDQEVSFVDRYLQLEKKRFPEKFDYEITVDSDIPSEKVFVPTLLVQTLAENAVKHAFKGLKTKGKIDIHYCYNNMRKLLTIKIVDNGIGLLNKTVQRTEDDDKSSFGLNLLKRRIDIYNERISDGRKAKVKIDYLDPEKKIGTKISLNIPLYEIED